MEEGPLSRDALKHHHSKTPEVNLKGTESDFKKAKE
jgi:hypothetical protein